MGRCAYEVSFLAKYTADCKGRPNSGFLERVLAATGIDPETVADGKMAAKASAEAKGGFGDVRNGNNFALPTGPTRAGAPPRSAPTSAGGGGGMWDRGAGQQAGGAGDPRGQARPQQGGGGGMWDRGASVQRPGGGGGRDDPRGGGGDPRGGGGDPRGGDPRGGNQRGGGGGGGGGDMWARGAVTSRPVIVKTDNAYEIIKKDDMEVRRRSRSLH